MKKTILLFAIIASSFICSAQDVSDACLEKLNNIKELIIRKDYAAAFPIWYEVYTECPSASKAIYRYGPRIIEYMSFHSNMDKEYLFNLLMAMYDNRIKYFGDDPKYPTTYILGEKGTDYIAHKKSMSEDIANFEVYKWLKDAMSFPPKWSRIISFFDCSSAIYKITPNAWSEQYEEDYELVNNKIREIQASGKYKDSFIANELENITTLYQQTKESVQ